MGTLADIPKILLALGSTVLSVWKLVAQVHSRYAQLQELRERDAESGLFFSLFYVTFQYFYGLGLILCGLALIRIG